jgi:hypothetical protein
MLRCILTPLILLAFVISAGAQDRAREVKPCDAKKISISEWCATCKRALGPLDVLENPRACKRCDEEPRKIEYCVKSFPPYFQASCHPEKKGPKPFVCCGKLHAKPVVVEDRALVRYDCKYCKATAATRGDLEHQPQCSNPFGVVRACTKSGTAPHVGK